MNEWKVRGVRKEGNMEGRVVGTMSGKRREKNRIYQEKGLRK